MRYLNLLLALCFCGVVEAQPLALPVHGALEVKGNLLHLVDSTNAISFDNIRIKVFQTVPIEESPNFGFDRNAHWFKLEVSNRTENEKFLLEVAYSVIDSIDFYFQTDGRWLKKTAGDMLPISHRDIAHRHPGFEFSLPPQQQATIYLKVKTISSVQVPLLLWPRDDFFISAFHMQMINGFFYGAVLIMMLYQFFLFLSTRDKLALYYAIALITMANIVSLFQGYGFLYLYPEKPFLNDWFAMFSGPALVTATTILTRAFLNLRKISRNLDNLLLTIMIMNLLAALLMVIFFRQLSYGIHHIFIIIHCVVELISAAYCLHKKYRPARFYLIAWFAILSATVLFTLSNLGIVPGYFSTNYSGLMVGFILQMLFISFALGDRINLLEKEYKRSKELENERLEKEVQVRTEEIQHKSERLEEVNKVKDKLFSVVSHDIKGPLGSLQLALALLKSGKVSQEEFKKISASLEVRFNETTEFVENLLQWATLQLKGNVFEPKPIDLSALARETIRLLEPELQKKQIQLTLELQSLLQVHADLNMTRSVLRNLLTNAIKFTDTGGAISLRAAEASAKEVIFSVADNGTGIPKENRDKLFTLGTVSTQGTEEEKGTGLGLMLCREFIEKSGGRIWFESTEGKGTTFFFTLPVYQHDKLSA
jgi:signal transduction histidine kinase